MILSSDEVDLCFSLVKRSVEFGFKHDCLLILSQIQFSSTMRQDISLYVSFTHKGKNVGCYGNPNLQKPLYESILEWSFQAGFNDVRFTGLNKNILEDLEVEISIFEDSRNPSIIFDIDEFCNQLQNNESVLINYKACSALFLNTVQKQFPDKREFMMALKQKALIPYNVAWHFINATKIRTSSSYKTKYCEIK